MINMKTQEQECLAHVRYGVEITKPNSFGPSFPYLVVFYLLISVKSLI